MKKVYGPTLITLGLATVLIALLTVSNTLPSSAKIPSSLYYSNILFYTYLTIVLVGFISMVTGFFVGVYYKSCGIFLPIGYFLAGILLFATTSYVEPHFIQSINTYNKHVLVANDFFAWIIGLSAAFVVGPGTFVTSSILNSYTDR